MSHGHDDFATEPVPGLPERLPDGERVLWRGAPTWKSLAKRALHVRSLSIYAAILVGWRDITTVYDGGTIVEGLIASGILAAVTGGAIAVLALLAYFYARDTIYTVTNKRVVIRFGIALPMTVQIPFTQIDGAGLKSHRDGSGDIPLEITDRSRVPYLIMWPNVRPWRIRRPQPMLRCIPDPDVAARILSEALAASLAETVAETAPVATASRPAAAQPSGRKPRIREADALASAAG